MHAKLGLDRCKGGLYSGAAPLSLDTQRFMRSLGLVICEIYGGLPTGRVFGLLNQGCAGMTENPNNNANVFNPVSGDSSRVRQGSVGQSATGCHTRLHLPEEGVGEVASSGRYCIITIRFASKSFLTIHYSHAHAFFYAPVRLRVKNFTKLWAGMCSWVT